MILKRLSVKSLYTWKIPVVYPATLVLDQADSIILEIGPGRGDFLYHLALTHPSSVIVAVEIKQKRVDRLVQRLQKRKIDNVLLIQGDARAALPCFLAHNSVGEIHINFPDPWPKKRHAKNRLMTPEFLRTCVDKLVCGGTIHFGTDEEWYATETHERFSAIDTLRPCYSEGIVTNPRDAFPTFFMDKWRKMGRTLHYQKYEKVAEKVIV